MFRPPSRDICLNALEEIYNTCKRPSYLSLLPISQEALELTNYSDEEARPAASKVLSRWRPDLVTSLQSQETHSANTNGVQVVNT